MAEVEILLATYNPDMGFFRKLLRSLNSQTFKSLFLSVVDDCSKPDVLKEIQAALETEIRNFPFRISENVKNLGSTKTFERLTREAECDALAYCDQDDIWEAAKIQALYEEMTLSRAALCYSDLSVIDKNDTLVAKSFLNVNKRVRHLAGEGLFKAFLRRNSVTGCTMLIPAGIARKALPFNDQYFVHDHWLALFASTCGSIAYIKEPLVRYRLHGSNQIGNQKLAGITDKQNYPERKLQTEIDKYEYLLLSGLFSDTQNESIRETLAFVNVRMRFFKKHSLSNTAAMLAILRQDPQLILFELLLAFAPDTVARWIIQRFQ